MPATWLIRHAPTDANASDVFMGSLDVPASAAGLEDARALAAAFDAHELGAVYVSPLCRARETAHATFPRITPRVDERLAERRLGTWEGRAKEELRQREPEAFLGRFLDLRHTPAGGESIEALCARVRAFLLDLHAADDGRPSVVISHNGVIGVMRYLLGHCELDDASAAPEPFLTPVLLRWTAAELRDDVAAAAAAVEAQPS